MLEMGSVPTYPAGDLKIVSIDGGADALSAALQPGPGFRWKVIDIWATHNDGTVRGLTWSYTDGVTTVAKKISFTVNSGDPVPLCWNGASSNPGANDMTAELILSNLVWATVSLAAISSGKKLFIYGLVMEYGL